MVDRIRNLLTRFPEDERTVREMIRNDRSLNALCEEYAQIGEELKRLAQRKVDPAAAIQVSGLQKRRMTIEEELLTLMEGYQPV